MLARRMVPAMFPIADIDRVFEEFFGPGAANWTGGATAAFPAMNVWEDKDNVVVEAELPGFKLEQVDITLNGDELTVAGHRETESKAEGTTWRRRERVSGHFTRSVRLPFEIDADKVDASMTNGVLTISLPKSDAVRTKKINVRAK